MQRNEPSREVDDAARAVIGAAIEVHKHLGPGLIESVYEHALMVEMDRRGLRYEQQKTCSVIYKGTRVGELRMDLIIENSVVVELKCVDALAEIHFAQLLSYLKASGVPLGLLMNFNTRQLKHGIRRIIRGTAEQPMNLVAPLAVSGGDLGDR